MDGRVKPGHDERWPAARDPRHAAFHCVPLGWPQSDRPGAAAMNAITDSKTPSQNRLEGFVLTTLFHGFPTYSAAVLMIKLMGAREIVGHPGGAVIFVAVTSL